MLTLNQSLGVPYAFNRLIHKAYLSDQPKPANGYHLKTGQRE